MSLCLSVCDGRRLNDALSPEDKLLWHVQPEKIWWKTSTGLIVLYLFPLPRIIIPFFSVSPHLHFSRLLSAYSCESLPPSLFPLISLLASGGVMTVRMECGEQEGAWRERVLGASWIEGRRELKKGALFQKGSLERQTSATIQTCPSHPPH